MDCTRLVHPEQQKSAPGVRDSSAFFIEKAFTNRVKPAGAVASDMCRAGGHLREVTSNGHPPIWVPWGPYKEAVPATYSRFLMLRIASRTSGGV